MRARQHSSTLFRRIHAAVRMSLPLGAMLSGLMMTQSQADQKDPRLPALFERLHDTGNPGVAKLTEFMIWKIWGQSGEPALDRLMEEGEVAMESQDFRTAEARFSAVIAAKPDFAEGWNRRATLYYLTGKYPASLADIEHVLELEPRHFGAISGLGVVNMALDHNEAAQDAFERVLSLYPLNVPAQENLKMIKKKLDDSEI
jgi:tetratricopeptide (TPR) repeat protein